MRSIMVMTLTAAAATVGGCGSGSPAVEEKSSAVPEAMPENSGTVSNEATRIDEDTYQRPIPADDGAGDADEQAFNESELKPEPVEPESSEPESLEPEQSVPEQ